MWMSWVAYWCVASFNVKTPTRVEPIGSRLLHIVPLLLAFHLIWAEKIR